MEDFFYCIANCALRNKMFCMEFSGVIISPWIPSRIKFCFRLHAFRIRMLWYFQEWCQPWFCIKCWFSDNRICRFAESYYQCICLCWFPVRHNADNGCLCHTAAKQQGLQESHVDFICHECGCAGLICIYAADMERCLYRCGWRHSYSDTDILQCYEY